MSAVIFNEEPEHEGYPEPEKLWVADDGSWGVGRIAVIDKDMWELRQLIWFNQYMQLVNEPNIDIVIAIDKKQEPNWDEYQ